MVYDRGRGPRDSHEGVHFGSSGSPRSRFPSDASSITQKQAPNRPRASSSDASLSEDNLPNAKVLVDLISERVYWYLQRDTADKKNKKLCHDVQRCQRSDFSSAADLLEVHSKAADLEKAKFSQRMTAIDNKLANATSSWWSKLDTAVQSKGHAGGDGNHDLTPPPSETSSDINLSIDEKLAQMRESLDASMRNIITEESEKLQSEVKDAYESRTATIQNHAMQESQKLAHMRSSLETAIRKQVNEESQKLQSKMKDNYEEKIASLKRDLSQEKELSRTLQLEMKNMSTKLASIETKIEDHAKISSQLDKTVKKEAFVDLQSRLDKFETAQAAINKKQKKNAKNVSSMEADKVQSQKLDSVTVHGLYLELEANLEDKMTQFLLQSGEKIVPNERVINIVQPNIAAVETNLQNALKRIADGFGTLIDREREMRGGLGVQVKEAAQSASAVAEALDEMKADLAEFKRVHDTNSPSAMVAIQNQGLEIQNLTKLLASTNDDVHFAKDSLQKLTTSLSSATSSMECTKGNLQKTMDALWLRSTNMQAWQDNFSSVKLYEAIVQHLNSSFMSEHLSALVDLKTRVYGIEGLLGESGNKKRKLADHSPFPSPSLPRK